RSEPLAFGIRQAPLDDDRLAIDVPVEFALGIVDVGEAIGHAGAEVPSCRTKDHHRAAGHVFTAMVADTFDDRRRSAVPDREALARLAREVELATGGGVEGGIPGEHLRIAEGRVLWRSNGDDAAGHPLADVVIRFPYQGQ